MSSAFFTDDEIEEIREAFNLFDSDGSDAISAGEFNEVMQSLGFDPKNQIIYQMISEKMEKDDGDDQAMDFQGFLDWMASDMKDPTNKEYLKKIFSLIDDDSTGKITFSNLKRLSKKLNENITEAELHEVIERADTNGDKGLDFDEFYAVMTRKNFT